MQAGKRKASPQTEQYDPCSGRSAPKQFSQTGSQETLRSGEPQIRQSAGNKVKNKVAATRSAKPANPCFADPRSANPWSAAWPWAARIRNPVLLKTSSRTRQANGALTGYTCLVYSAAHTLCNAAIGLHETSVLSSQNTPLCWELRTGLRQLADVRAALVNQPFGMLRCAVAATVNRQ